MHPFFGDLNHQITVRNLILKLLSIIYILHKFTHKILNKGILTKALLLKDRRI